MASTIRDVARLAGVCIGTVSRVINNRDKVDPATRRRILRLIAKTGYRPSAMGRALALRRTHNIVLHVPNIADPYYARLSKLTSANCRERGYRMLLGDSDYDEAMEAETLRRCRDGGADGLLISPLPSQDNVALYRELVRADFPVVLIDNDVPAARLNCVKYDDKQTAILAMEHLFERGHRRIAFLGWRREYQTVRDRIQGYHESLRRHGVAASDEYFVTLPPSLDTMDSGLLDRLMARAQPPTAILAENEILSVICLNALGRMVKRVPQDVAVIGIGDALMDQLSPAPLTTVSLGQEEACALAVRLLLDLAESPAARRKAPAKHIVKPRLIVRATT
jgi:DNA-binding LacI/PurR family transcriptional regulator